MKNKILYTLVSLLLSGLSLSAQYNMNIHQKNSENQYQVSEIKNIKLTDTDGFLLNFTNGEYSSISINNIDSLTFEPNTETNDDIIRIIYNENEVTITNPYADKGVYIVNSQAHVTVVSSTAISGIHYYISGNTSNGSLTINSSQNFIATMDNVEITNPNNVAVYFSGTAESLIRLYQTNNLSDAADGSGNSVLRSQGSLSFDGTGTLNIQASQKHGINTPGTVTISGGCSIFIHDAAGDGIHCEGFTMEQGYLEITNAASDGIDAGSNIIQINAGQIAISSQAADIKGIKSDNTIILNGGTINLNIEGAQSKGISAKADIIINNTNLTITTSGNTILENSGSGYDPSHCTAIKGDGNIYIYNGTINIRNASSNDGGRGIAGKGNIEINGGKIAITTAGNGGTYINEYGENDDYTTSCIQSDADILISGGSITCNIQGKGGKGISADNTILISTGNIMINATGEDTKGIRCDNSITIDAGHITMELSGNQSKGISSKGDLTINDPVINIKTTGKTILESSGNGYNPSYCSAIKGDKDIYINAGNIVIENTSSNDGGKGISANGNITVTNGEITITTAGNGSTYTNESGTADSYTSCCIKSDANISILGGTITCTSTGSGGKGIAAEGELIIGERNAANDLLTLIVKTSGERFLVSSSTGNNGGWGNNMNDNSDYANPKAVKSTGNMTLNSGTVTINCTQSQEGGEGLESKATLIINGGIITIQSYDDCINAAHHIAINEGISCCVSTGNDAIDSNGTITITGGLTIANGTSSPEGGFDCDNNTFTITGGIAIGTGGESSSPTTNTSTQNSIKYSATAGNAIRILNSSNETILLYQLPTLNNSSSHGPGGSRANMSILFSHPGLTNGSYTLNYGGTISGENFINGYYSSGNYSGGSTKSFTINSKLTSL
jgi:hypothetical protein